MSLVLALHLVHPGDVLAAVYSCGLCCIAGAAGLLIGTYGHILTRWALVPLVLVPLLTGLVVLVQTAFVWS